MGIHPDISSFDRRSSDLDDARLAMWLWAEAVIVDRAVEVYARALDEAGAIALTRRHCRLWRAVFFEQPSVIQAAMDDIRRAAAGLGLAEVTRDEVDEAIIEELVDIVTSRYRSSRNALKTFSLVLMSITSRLGSVRSAP